MPSFDKIFEWGKKYGWPALTAVFLAWIVVHQYLNADDATKALAAAEARTRQALEKCDEKSKKEHKETRAVIRLETTKVQAAVQAVLDGGLPDVAGDR